MIKIYKATCDKCKIVVVKGFNIATTERILSKHLTCAFCNKNERITTTIEEL